MTLQPSVILTGPSPNHSWSSYVSLAVGSTVPDLFAPSPCSFPAWPNEPPIQRFYFVSALGVLAYSYTRPPRFCFVWALKGTWFHQTVEYLVQRSMNFKYWQKEGNEVTALKYSSRHALLPVDKFMGNFL